MLIRFTVSNFLSFKDETEFNMLTGDVKRHPHHVYKREHIDVLRAAAIYGANGAGKSNLIKAIQFLKSLVEGEDILKSYENFKLSKEYLDKPSQLEIEIELNGIVYAYGIVFNHQRIIEEWLYIVNFDKDDEMIFERTTDENLEHHLKLADKFLKTERDRYFVEFYEKELINSSKTFTAITKDNENEEIKDFRTLLIAKMSIYSPNTRSYVHFAKMLFLNDLKEFNNILKLFDTGVNYLKVSRKQLEDEELENKYKQEKETLQKGPIGTLFRHDKKIQYICREDKTEKSGYYLLEISSIHSDSNGNEVEFDLEMESDGTIKLLDFISILIHISESNSVFIIDEIDRSIHPSLLKTFMKILMDMKETKGQIIFTTHESNLLDLDIFRQDEIWFAEKNKEGATQFYSLSDFKPRYDLDIRKGYLNGRFGAIPFLGDLEKLNLNNHAETE
jgi:uncharacterized protein